MTRMKLKGVNYLCFSFLLFFTFHNIPTSKSFDIKSETWDLAVIHDKSVSFLLLDGTKAGNDTEIPMPETKGSNGGGDCATDFDYYRKIIWEKEVLIKVTSEPQKNVLFFISFNPITNANSIIAYFGDNNTSYGERQENNSFVDGLVYANQNLYWVDDNGAERKLRNVHLNQLTRPSEWKGHEFIKKRNNEIVEYKYPNPTLRGLAYDSKSKQFFFGNKIHKAIDRYDPNTELVDSFVPERSLENPGALDIYGRTLYWTEKLGSLFSINSLEIDSFTSTNVTTSVFKEAYHRSNSLAVLNSTHIFWTEGKNVRYTVNGARSRILHTFKSNVMGITINREKYPNVIRQ